MTWIETEDGMGLKYVLSDEQKKCSHDMLEITADGAGTYFKYGEIRHKTRIRCYKCGVPIACGGGIYINDPETCRGIIREHWPDLIEEETCPSCKKQIQWTQGTVSGPWYCPECRHIKDSEKEEA